ncbi:MAG: hypothetical protein CMA46_00245, partial [Euryarchaeota archaeon]|nr:hypothetical protein [Euryarchaeota archaeon]
SFEHLPENLLDVDVILMRSAQGSNEIAEVAVLADYPDSDTLLLSGILLCIPSFGLMGLFVGHVRSERRPDHSG